MRGILVAKFKKAWSIGQEGSSLQPGWELTPVNQCFIFSIQLVMVDNFFLSQMGKIINTSFMARYVFTRITLVLPDFGYDAWFFIHGVQQGPRVFKDDGVWVNFDR